MIPRFLMLLGRRKAREKCKRAELLAKELAAALHDEQGPQQPFAYWRWPMGIGAHAIALCAIALLACALIK